MTPVLEQEIQTLAQTYPVSVQRFMRELLLERAMLLLHRKAPTGWAYPCYQDLLLDLADGPVVAPIATDDALGVMEEQRCYSNCYDAALEYADYTYVEGVALASWAIVVRHAWLVDPDGRIIDPTWVNLDLGDGTATYFGVRFTDDFLLAHTLSTGLHSFFDADWMNNHQILKRGFQVDETGRAHALGGNL